MSAAAVVKFSTTTSIHPPVRTIPACLIPIEHNCPTGDQKCRVDHTTLSPFLEVAFRSGGGRPWPSPLRG